MKQFVNKRSLTFFLAASAVFIAVTSFLSGYTENQISLVSPFLIIFAAGTTALLFEATMQRRAK